MKNFLTKIAYLIYCLCVGCAEHSPEQNSIIDNNKEFDEICHRVAKLNMTVVAPGSGIWSGLAVKMKSLKEYGLNIPHHVLINKDIFSGIDSDDNRLNRLIDAINSDYKIIWALRGGYGTSRLIASLDRMQIPNTNKTFIGFCDVTAANLFISQKWPNWRVIHAPVLIYLDRWAFSKDKFDTLLNILENKIDSYDIDGVFPLNDKAKGQKSIVGKLTGGNLSIIESSLKTCWEIKTDERILFIEDIDEKPQRIYRMLYHLKEAGKLSNIKALIFGYFHKTGDEKLLRLYLKAFSNTISAPVYITNQFGHGLHNMPLIYGATTKIYDNKMTVTVGANPLQK